ncbi:uncharacterized protein LOC119718996 [Patiria miniata]|uniref:Uncharacterized protein n=1 Tax=Patiria miniata TaxID=46514 RepID=A0A913YZY3_PATMI|nr:uncharacterized protein LOC119718996 [Patiria miniata]
MKPVLKRHIFWLVLFKAFLLSEMLVSALDLQLPGNNQPRCAGISRGKHFVLGFIDSYDDRYLASRELSILVVAFSNQQTTVTISSKHEIAGEPFQETFVIDAGGFMRTNVPVELVMVNTERSQKVLEISASSDVSAYGLIYQDYTTDGFLGIPTNNLGTQYVVITSRPIVDHNSQFAVIGTEDFTLVQVILRGAVTFEGQSYSPGDVLRFAVNNLEAVQIQGQSSVDLTGSIIQSDKPVVVFSGNECTSHAGSYCDTVTEQLVPVKSWGLRHIYTAARSDDDNIYRIVAYFNETNLTIPGLEHQSLEPGDFWEGRLSGSGLVTSSKPALMMQHLASINGITVDPSIIQVPAEEHFGFVFGFTTPPHSGEDSGGYFNFINIIVKRESRHNVYLNSLPINGRNVLVSDVPHTSYISLTVQLPKGEGVYYVEQIDPYSAPLSVIVYGYEDDESYGYAAGLSLPSNNQVPSLIPYYLRELGGELFTMTVPCLQTNDMSFQLAAKCKFSTGFGDVIVSGERTDSYNVVCITPIFYKKGLTSVYVSLDDGESFPYSGIVYIASEEDLPPLLQIQQVNSEYGDGIIDLTSDDPIMFSWDPRSLDEEVSHVTVMIQDTDNDSDGNPVLMEGVAVKNHAINNGSLMIHPRALQSLTSDGLSLAAFYLTPSGLRRRGNIGCLLWRIRYYGPAVIIVTAITCEISKYQLKNTVPTGLSPCPCNTRQVERDLNFQEANFANFFFHPGAENCYRSVNSLPTGAGQQCCYGRDGNILVGPPGGGTADSYCPSDWNTVWHQWFDVVPWLCLCKLSNNCKEYYKYRPSDDCSNYEPPRPAGGTGDPHVTSFDGYKFTFNGAGEFLMASSAVKNLTFQARMERYRNTNASVYTAFVFQTNDSSKVQVQMSNIHETLILVDGEPLRLDSLPVKVHHLRGVRIRFNSNMNKINVAFNSGIAVTVYIDTEMMSFIAQLDTKFQGQIQGLLGNLNGNPDDDLQFPNGTILEPGSSLKEIHEFGLEWLVAPEESIFTYISPFDYNTYYLPEFSPTFEVPDLNLVSQEIKDLCGDSIECVFDAVITGSLSFANETLVVTVTITEVQKGLVKIVSCGYPGDVENGLLSGSVYFVNATVDVACDDGFTLKGTSKLTCLEDGQWSSDLPVCAVNCGYPGDVENGLLLGSVYLVNATVDVACDDGFTLKGSSRLICLEDGQWSSDLPVCAVDCGYPGDVKNGLLSGSVYLVNATVDVACDDGFILKGSSRLSCLEDGQWSSGLPVCAVDCGYPGDVENGLLSGSVYLVNATVDVACDDGFTLKGSSRLTCLEDGQWSSDLPVCAVDCGYPGDVENGLLSGSVYLVNATVDVACDDGFTLKGSSRLTCLEDGQWSSGLPVCAVDCGYPGDVKNGLLSGSVYLVNYTVAVTCDDGFILKGFSRLTCLEDGQWSSDLPICVVNCGYPGDVENGLLSGSVYLVNATVDVACDDGFTLKGSPKLTCLEDGQWSSGLPVCAVKIVNCGYPGDVANGSVSGSVHFVNATVDVACDDGFTLNGSARLTCLEDGHDDARS